MDRQLIEAIKQNDVDRARLLATDQELRRYGMNSVLELAVDLGQTDSVRALLTDHLSSETGSLNPEHASRALRLACRFPEEDTALCMVTALLEHGAGCHQRHGARCERWGPSLLVASDRGHTRVIRLLIEHCKAVDCSKHKDVLFEGTALDHAAFNGRKEVVKLLLAHGACVNQDTTNQKPLASAARRGHTEIIQLLCEHDAPTDKVKGFALVEAAKYGQGEAVYTLCRLGADPNFTSRSNASPLLTTQNQREDVIRALCANADLVVTWSSKDYRPLVRRGALHLAAEAGHTDVIEALCANGADVNLIVENRTPLFQAAVSGHADAIDVLCANGADVDLAIRCTAKGVTAYFHAGCIHISTGTTALKTACKRGHLDAVTRLLKNGCNINLKDRWGNTALHFSSHACEYCSEWESFKEYPRIVEQLVSQPDCDCRAKDALGRTALDQAISSLGSPWGVLYRLQIAQVLIKAGCTQSASDEDYVGLLVQHLPTTLPIKQNELLECLKLMLLAGWPVTRSTSELMSRPDIKEELMTSFVFDYITRPHDNSPSLKHLCKFVIRRELRTPLERHLADTGLPPLLRKFVLLQSL